MVHTIRLKQDTRWRDLPFSLWERGVILSDLLHLSANEQASLGADSTLQEIAKRVGCAVERLIEVLSQVLEKCHNLTCPDLSIFSDLSPQPWLFYKTKCTLGLPERGVAKVWSGELLDDAKLKNWAHRTIIFCDASEAWNYGAALTLRLNGLPQVFTYVGHESSANH